MIIVGILVCYYWKGKIGNELINFRYKFSLKRYSILRGRNLKIKVMGNLIIRSEFVDCRFNCLNRI